MKESIYVDPNVFILPVIYAGLRKADRAEKVLRKIVNKEVVAYTSALTWDEVVWVVLKALGREDSVEVRRKLLGFPNLRLIDVDEKVVSRAQSLMERYSITPRDAIHCSSALTRGLRRIVSDDEDFDVVKEVERIPVERLT